MNETFQHVLYAVDHGVGRLTLNRPEKRNALGIGPGSNRDEIVTVLNLAVADSAVHCVLIDAVGPSFCAGGDLSSAPVDTSDLAEVRFVAAVDEFHARVRAFSKPLIMAVQGHCLGAGLAFACQGDFILAADDALFGLPEGRFGHPGGAELAAIIGPAWAKFLIFSGDQLSARQAVAIGLALVEIARDDLADRAAELAKRIARMPPAALSLNKASIDRATEAAGRAAGRLAGRAGDTLTKQLSVLATAPDGRRFEEIRQAEGPQGIKAAQSEQFTGSWLRSITEKGSSPR